MSAAASPNDGEIDTAAPSVATADDDPLYRVIPPHDGAEPDEIEYTEDGVTHRYWDFRGYESRSRFAPDVLLYAEHETVVVDGGYSE